VFLFNLSLAEFMALFSAASAVVFALYLLDRSRRKVVVPTLRFWNEAARPVESTRRRRITQWPSLLLQLASIALLLLALSQLRIGSPDQSSRDHVVLLDTSSWMAASVDRVALMDQAKRLALAYAKAVPSTDRLMIVYTDTMSVPATAFEGDRRKIEAAIRKARPSTAALDLHQALDFARSAQERAARRGGEIVFAGAGRLLQNDGTSNFAIPPNLRVLSVEGTPDNAGIRKIGLRRSSSESDLWHVYVSMRNYGKAAQPVELALQFGGAPIGSRRLQINGGAEQEAAFEFRTRAAGILEARIRSRRDSFPGDDRATLELPSQPIVPVTVCSDDPNSLRPLLKAHASIEASFKSVAQCPPAVEEGIAIYDRFVPARLPGRAILIEPPSGRSPIPVRSIATGVRLDQWLNDHPLSRGLHTKDFQLDSARVFNPSKDDIRVAQSTAGPVIVARPGMVVFGFHPMRSSLRYELATPLLFANVIRWLVPESFRATELFASPTGNITVPLEVEGPVEVLAAEGSLPYSISGKNLRFFAGTPGTVRVRSGDREQVFSLTLPDVPEGLWEAPAGTRRGIPRAREIGSSSSDIWYWLALFGGLGLLIEWLLFSPAAVQLPARIASKIGKLAAAALLATAGNAQTRAPGNDSILRAELEAELHFLASDLFRGRLTGTPETLMSVQWIESRFKRLGLPPVAGNSHQQHYNLTWATLAAGNRMRISWGAAANEPRVLEDFSPLFFTPSASAKGKVTFAGYGIDAPALAWSDMRGPALQGRIALILEGEPAPDDPKSIFDGVVTSVHSDPLRKALNLQAKGAIGVLIVNPSQKRFAADSLSYWPEKPPHLKRYAITSWADELRIPVASISPAAAAKILGGGLTKLAGDSARDGGSVPVPVDAAEVELEIRVDKHVIDDVNVVAKIEGVDPTLTGEAIIISAHYDHNGAEGSQIYNGADDNGSGTVGLLEIAEAYAIAARGGHRPKRSVIFAAWGSEERCCGPLLGAWAWIRQPGWPIEKTAAVLNMDMIGRSEEVPEYGGARFRGLPVQTAASNATAVNIIGTSYSSDMKAAVTEANRTIDMNLRFRYDNNPSNLLRRSDQWPFLQSGVPALWFHSGLHPDYHTTFDRPERIDYGKVERIARLVHQLSWNLANQTGRPSMIPNRRVPPPD
jgi:hypothetical protein